MTPQMTSRERVLAALRREPVDYVPCTPFFNPLSAVQRRGRVWNFPWSPDASVEDRLTYQIEQLGVDPVVHVGANVCRALPEVTSKTWVEDGILHKTYTTPSGDLHASVRYSELWPQGEDISFYSDFNIGHFVEPWLQNESDLACFKDIIRLDDGSDVVERARAGYEGAKALTDRLGLATAGGGGTGLTGALQLFGAKELCLLTVENPELVDDYLEHEHQITLRALEVLGELGVDVARRNGFYETADFYGPQMLERFLGKRLRAEIQTAHDGGMLTTYTVHSGVMPILDYLAALPFDSLMHIDIAFEGVDVYQVKEKVTKDKSLWTGPSSTYHLWKGPEPTRQAVRDVFGVFGKTGLILSPCVSAHSIMPWESTLAMLDEWRELR